MIIWKIIRSVLCSIVCTVQCTHMNRPNSCLLVSLACLWLYCVLQFICVRFSFLWLLFFVTSIVYVCIRVCFCCAKFSFCSTVPKDCLRRTSPKWCILYRVWCKTWTLAGINASLFEKQEGKTCSSYMEMFFFEREPAQHGSNSKTGCVNTCVCMLVCMCF